MSCKRVLVATPVYGDMKVPYTLGLAEVMRDVRDYELIPSVTRGTYVQVARDAAVAEARKLGCDTLFFWDSDVEATAAQFRRILGHGKPIVGGIYAKRQAGEPQWTIHATGGPQEGELLPVNDIAAGFLSIEMGIFTQIDKMRGCEAGELPYFPVQTVEKGGWRTPAEAKLEAIAGVLRGDPVPRGVWGALSEIEAIIAGKPHSEVIGDDISFCRMAKAAGVPLYADTGVVLRHHGDIGYPAKEI